MLRSIKQLYGNKLGASDGEIGHVKDFYFDDQNWAIRYVVVDTGSWLPGRQVLISPRSLGCLDQADKVLRADLTRKQIEDSPSIELHKPVSRQYEEEYHRYYGWPLYWAADGSWSTSNSPITEGSAKTLPDEPKTVISPQSARADARLRSTQAVNGYHLKTSDATIGHVCDFMMDTQSWAISQLVIKTGHRLSGKEELIAVKQVNRISYEESTMFADLAPEVVEQPPARVLAPIGTGVEIAQSIHLL